MNEQTSQQLLQDHVAEKCARDKKAKRSGIVKITLYSLGASLEAVAYKLGEIPHIWNIDNALGFGGAAIAGATSLHAAAKARKHEAQLQTIEQRCEANEINSEQALRETEHHIDHRRVDTKRYVGLTSGGLVLSTTGFGHALASGHMDNHWIVMLAAASIVVANGYSVHSMAEGMKNIVRDKTAVKRVARARKFEQS